jgi:uncharacterized membrane protein (DUF485 family)
MSINPEKVKAIVESDEFKELTKKRQTFSLTMTGIILVVYFGFILTIAFQKEVLAAKIGDSLTIGIPIGIGIIIFAWILTGIYTRWANKSYDKSVRELRNRILEK